MGSTSYNFHSRVDRASLAGYATNTVNENFKQNKLRRIHESMEPKKAKLREARDSATHPNTVPIILALDVTGSMHTIPQQLVQEGLPHMMAGIIQNGIPDPALLFLAVGDTQVDQYPLQVGQFESGDEELDTWLTRTYLEGGGGGNAGESYLLAWYFASKHTVTDAWEKRHQKGFLFTVGDEPCLKMVTKSDIAELTEDGIQAGMSDEELLKEAQEKWNVYHLHILEGSAGERSLGYWQTLLGQNCIAIKDHRDVAKTIAKIVTEHSANPVKDAPAPATVDGNKKEEIYL